MNKTLLHDLIPSSELAEATGLSWRRIAALGPELVNAGLAKYIGRPLICHVDAIEYIKNRPDGRRKKSSP